MWIDIMCFDFPKIEFFQGNNSKNLRTDHTKRIEVDRGVKRQNNCVSHLASRRLVYIRV